MKNKNDFLRTVLAFSLLFCGNVVSGHGFARAGLERQNSFLHSSKNLLTRTVSAEQNHMPMPRVSRQKNPEDTKAQMARLKSLSEKIEKNLIKQQIIDRQKSQQEPDYIPMGASDYEHMSSESIYEEIPNPLSRESDYIPMGESDYEHMSFESIYDQIPDPLSRESGYLSMTSGQSDDYQTAQTVFESIYEELDLYQHASTPNPTGETPSFSNRPLPAIPSEESVYLEVLPEIIPAIPLKADPSKPKREELIIDNGWLPILSLWWGKPETRYLIEGQKETFHQKILEAIEGVKLNANSTNETIGVSGGIWNQEFSKEYFISLSQQDPQKFEQSIAKETERFYKNFLKIMSPSDSFSQENNHFHSLERLARNPSWKRIKSLSGDSLSSVKRAVKKSTSSLKGSFRGKGRPQISLKRLARNPSWKRIKSLSGDSLSSVKRAVKKSTSSLRTSFRTKARPQISLNRRSLSKGFSQRIKLYRSFSNRV